MDDLDTRLADCEEALAIVEEAADRDIALREAAEWVVRTWEQGRASTAALRRLQATLKAAVR